MWSFANTVMVSYITFTLLQTTIFPLGGPPLLFWSFLVGAVLFAIIYYVMASLVAQYVGLHGASLQLFANHYVVQESPGWRYDLSAASPVHPSRTYAACADRIFGVGQMSWVLQYGPESWRHYLAYTQGTAISTDNP
jgi:hypothetical protein